VRPGKYDAGYGRKKGDPEMGSGFGSTKGTLTFPGLRWRQRERTAEEIAVAPASDDPFDRCPPVERCDLVLRVVGEGWGQYAGYTVVDPDDGEKVEVPALEGLAVGTLTYDESALVECFSSYEVYGRDPEPQRVVVHYEALERFLSTKKQRVDSARQRLTAAERAVEEARERLARVEAGDRSAL